MTSTIDVEQIEAEIAQLEQEIAHRSRHTTHCQQLAKTFLLRELQNELERLRLLDDALSPT